MADEAPLTLKDHRLARGMLQGQVAEKAGCSVSLVCQVERGYTPKKPDKLEAIAQAVGASYGSFWGGA